MQFRYLLILSMFIGSQAFCQTAKLTWTSPVSVTKGAAYGNSKPKIALTRNNIPVVVWGNTATATKYVARLNGTTFATPVQINPVGVSPIVSMWEGAHMAASGDTVYVVYKTSPREVSDVYIVSSYDGGVTFGDTVSVENIDTNLSSYPTVAVTSDGDPVVAFIKYLPGWAAAKYVVVSSNDLGASFGLDVDASTLAPGEACDCCPATLMTRGIRRILLFRNNDSDLRNIWSSVSTNGGTSFTYGGDIDLTNWNVTACPTSGPDGIIVGDSIIAVWMSRGNGFSRVYVSTSDYTSIGYKDQISGNVASNVVQNYPMIAGNLDTVGVVWQETYSGDNKCIISYSLNGASGLQGNVSTIFSDTGVSVFEDKNPDIAFANGKFYIVWQDDEKGEVMFTTAAIQSTIGVEEDEVEIENVVLSPNPIKGEAILRFAHPNSRGHHVKVIDTFGKLVISYEHISGGSVLIDGTKLSAGMYFYSVYNEKGSIAAGKFVVE